MSTRRRRLSAAFTGILAVLAAVGALVTPGVLGSSPSHVARGVTIAADLSMELPQGSDPGRYKVTLSSPPTAAVQAVLPVVTELYKPRQLNSSRPVPTGTKLFFDVRKGLNPKTLFEAYFDPSRRRWVQEATTYNPQTGVATATVAHFSTHGLFAWNPDQIKQWLLKALGQAFGALAHPASQPQCGPANGVLMNDTGGESVLNCHDAAIVQKPRLGNPGEASIGVKLANDRQYPVDVYQPSSATDKLSDTASLAEEIGAGITRLMTTPTGTSMTLLPGGDSAEIMLPHVTAPFHQPVIRAQFDGEAYLVSILDTAISELSWMYNGDKESMAKDFLSWIGGGNTLQEILTQLPTSDFSLASITKIGNVGLDTLEASIDHGHYDPLGLLELTKVVVGIMQDAWETVSGFIDNLSGQTFHRYWFDTYGSAWSQTIETTTASVAVPADAQGGVNTGIYALKGDTIVILGSGSAGYGYEGTQPCAGNPTTHPDGSRYLGSFNCGPKDDPNATLSGAAIGLLIARISSGAWFGVGTRTTVTAGGSGYIYLAYNDSTNSDNTGSYSATITKNGTGTGG